MIQIEAEILHIGPQQEQGRPHRQHEQHQADGQDQVQLGQPPHPLVHPGQHRDRRRPHDHDDQPDLHRHRIGQARHIVQA
ncbi:hypothetical protein D3C86_1891910 [compost metagenome]